MFNHLGNLLKAHPLQNDNLDRRTLAQLHETVQQIAQDVLRLIRVSLSQRFYESQKGIVAHLVAQSFARFVDKPYASSEYSEIWTFGAGDLPRNKERVDHLFV
jgi:hypothetical protein